LSVGRDSVVGMTACSGLDGLGIESLWRWDFPTPFLNVHGAHPSSYARGTGSFPGVKRARRGVGHLPSCSSEVKERVKLCLHSPYMSSCHVRGRPLTLPLLYVQVTVHRDNLRANNQQDAWSIQNFILSRNSTCFGHLLCLSSGVMIYCFCLFGIDVLYVQVTVHRDNLRVNNQQDASSIQNFILSRNSTCFGHLLCLSSGVSLLVIYTKIITMYGHLNIKVRQCQTGKSNIS
jgi:hypothetical protein